MNKDFVAINFTTGETRVFNFEDLTGWNDGSVFIDYEPNWCVIDGNTRKIPDNIYIDIIN